MILSSLTPQYGPGGNYDLGYVGFQYSDSNIFSKGIAHFSRFERLSQIRVSHCFIVSGAWECVEASGAHGVRTASLDERFKNPQLAVFFRKPAGYTESLGKRIAAATRRQVGKPYDVRLCAAHALSNLWVMRRLLSKNARNNFELWAVQALDNPDAWICSELAAYALDAQPELRDLGCLHKPDSAIRPQELFEDSLVFYPWKDQAPASEGESSP